MKSETKRKFSAIDEEPIGDDEAELYQPRSRRRLIAMFECGYCFQKFTTERTHLYHEMIHTLHGHELKQTVYFKCNVCQMNFQTKNELDGHVKVHEKPFKCEECDENFDEKVYLDRHRKMHWTNKKWLCKKCPKMYPCERQLQCHERIHEWIELLDVKSFDCTDVYLIFESDDNQDKKPLKALLVYENTNDKFGLFECSLCNAKFDQMHKKLEHECRYHLPEIRISKIDDKKLTELKMKTMNSAEPKTIDPMMEETDEMRDNETVQGKFIE